MIYIYAYTILKIILLTMFSLWFSPLWLLLLLVVSLLTPRPLWMVSLSTLRPLRALRSLWTLAPVLSVSSLRSLWALWSMFSSSPISFLRSLPTLWPLLSFKKMDDTKFLRASKQGNLALLLLELIHTLYYDQSRLPAYVIDGKIICVPTPIGSTARAKGIYCLFIRVTDTRTHRKAAKTHWYKSTFSSLIIRNRVNITVYGSNGDRLFLEPSNDIIHSLCQLLAALMEQRHPH